MSFTRKNKYYIFAGLALVFLVALVIIGRDKDVADSLDSSLEKQEVEVLSLDSLDFKRILNSIGRVHSFNEANLSAELGGVVRQINYSIGDFVNQGQTLISLDSLDAESQLIQAELSLASEEARLRELISGERPERLTILQSSVTSAELALSETKRQTEKAINDAYESLLNNDLRFYLKDPNLKTDTERDITPPTVSGVYKGGVEGEYSITLYRSGTESGYSFLYNGPGGETGTGVVNTDIPQRLGNKGLYILFPENFARFYNLEWVLPVPNDRSSTYLTFKNAYERAIEEREFRIKQAEEVLKQRKEELVLIESGATEEQIAIQEARVKQAESTVASAINFFQKRSITAPFTGEIVNISTKIGENVSPGQTVISLANEGLLKIKIFVSPDNARLISVGDKALVSEKYEGVVVAKSSGVDVRTGQIEVEITINENSDLIVGEYKKVKIFIDSNDELTWLPLSAVRVDSEGSFVFTVKDSKTEKIPVEIGKVEGEYVSVYSGIEDISNVVIDSRKVSEGQTVDVISI